MSGSHRTEESEVAILEFLSPIFIRDDTAILVSYLRWDASLYPDVPIKDAIKDSLQALAILVATLRRPARKDLQHVGDMNSLAAELSGQLGAGIDFRD